MPLSAFMEKIKVHVPNAPDVLGDGAIETIALAVLSGQFSKDFPRVVVADIAGDGGFDYDLPTPTDKEWQTKTSTIKQIEYPAGEQVPLIIEDKHWTIYENTSGEQLRFLNAVPSSSETIRVTYTVVYVEDTIDTIPLLLQEAFALLAARWYADTLARFYAQTESSTLEVNAIDYENKSQIWADRAKDLGFLYMTLTGKKAGVSAASVTSDQDNLTSWGNDYWTHPRRFR